MGTSDVLKVLKIARAKGENFQNITRAHKSRNARVEVYMIFIYYILHKIAQTR